MTSDLKELQKAAYEGKKAIQNMVDTERPDGQKVQVQAQATGRGKDSVYDGEFGNAYGRRIWRFIWRGIQEAEDGRQTAIRQEHAQIMRNQKVSKT